jgi:hypothetical protein
MNSPKTRRLGCTDFAQHTSSISQTDGEPLAEFAKISGDPQDAIDCLKEFIVAKSIALEYNERIRPAHGLSSGGKITVLPGLTSAEEFSVMVHETAHELLQRGERRSQTNHVIRETEAEAVAFVVSTAIGLDPGTSSSDYIQLHLGDKTTLAESLGYVQRTAAEILNVILPDATTRESLHTLTKFDEGE